jgi:hypothetical protein
MGVTDLPFEVGETRVEIGVRGWGRLVRRSLRPQFSDPRVGLLDLVKRRADS